jgi:hypothetical protein
LARSLHIEEAFFHLQATAEAHETAILAHNTMTGHHDREGIS